MRRPVIAIIDYGAGNLSSLKSNLYRLGYKLKVVSTPEQCSNYDLLLMPGVGQFSSAMEQLNTTGLGQLVVDKASSGTPVVGICLGLQLFCQWSEEGGGKGLGLLNASVEHIEGESVHVGWSRLNCISQVDSNLYQSDEYYYFNHSYCLKIADDFVVARSNNDFDVASIVRKDNLLGFQFHPEKSQYAGTQLLEKSLKSLCYEN